MKTVGIQEAEGQLRDLIDDAIEGKEVFIVKNSSQIVQLVRVKPPIRRPQFGSAKDLIELADDFDAPLEDLREYMSRICC
jgi:antitoxin (DNA-binding transcriptional repressor) of toxin-antitoxin stability system